MADHLGYIYAILNHLLRQGCQITLIVMSGYLEFKQRDYTKLYGPPSTRIVGRDIIYLAGRVWVIPNLIAPLNRWKHRALALIWRSSGKQAVHNKPFDESVGEFPNEGEARRAGRLVDKCRPDFVFFDTIFLMKVLDFINVGTKSIVLTHDVFHRRYLSLVARGYRVGPQGFSREVASALLARRDTIAAIQPEEAALFR